jgi:alpha/beta superfamily hydrolase
VPISAAEFDRLFDEGADIDHLIDWEGARRPNLELRRVNVDFPAWVVQRLDEHAKRRGVSRQALIKMWLTDRLDRAG